MSISSFLSGLRDAFVGRDRDRAATFHELVVAVADGQTPSADDVDAVLAASGRVIGDLQPAVERILRRRELRALLDAAAETEAERPAIKARLSTLRDELDRAKEKHAQLSRPLLAQLRDITENATAARAAEAELARTADEEIVNKMTAVNKEIHLIGRELRAAGFALVDIRNNVRLPEGTLPQDREAEILASPGVQIHMDKISKLKARQTALMGQLAELRKRAIEVD
jgi:chromosome segregation ATPase